MMGPVRWSALEHSHELYNLGHMYEAAVAWHEATGRRDFLDVAIRSADLVDRTFGPGATQLKGVPGHEEIELALVRLYRATGERRYLDLARFFLDRRGFGVKTRAGKVFAQDGSLVEAGNAAGNYSQQHMPVREQREAVGHAVRANYLYCGMADVAALTGDKGLLDAIDAIWEDVVSRKLHINGGCGARPEGEAYGAAYELPNDYGETYLETCAAIANALWNERMFRLHGEAKYIDVLERTIYNGFLSGISLSGDEYFYPNPLASKGGYSRSKWFNCSCCPVNDLRFVPQIPAFAFASKKGVVYWNLFMSGQARIGYGATAAEGPFVRVRQTTDYPWSGRAELVVLGPDAESNGDWRGTFALKVRIPLWARGKPVPGDLYVQTVPASVSEVSLSVDGRAVEVSPGVDGYVEISREWKAGDRVVLELPLDVKRIKAHDNVAADRGRLAVERGPILYCAEGVDNGGKAYDARIPAGAAFEDAQIAIGDKSFPALKSSNGVVLVPYCLWGNREKGGELQTWF